MAIAAARGKLIAVIGDEDTCIGFVLGGVGEMNKNRNPNFMVVDKNTSIGEIEETFRGYLKRDDIGIILINQNVRHGKIVLCKGKGSLSVAATWALRVARKFR